MELPASLCRCESDRAEGKYPYLCQMGKLLAEDPQVAAEKGRAVGSDLNADHSEQVVRIAPIW